MFAKKIRISPMKLKISWTKLGKEEEQFMKLTKFVSALKTRNLSFKQHWRKQSQPWSKRKTRFFVLNWNLVKSNKKLKALERHTKEQLNQCKAHWKLRQKQRVRQSDIRKKLEADLNELDIALEHANGANSEAQQTIKKYQNNIKESQLTLEQEQQHRDKAREQLIQAERKSHAVRNQLEETKTQLEHADRQRRSAEQELSDVMEQVADCTLQNQHLQSNKRKLDSEMQTMHADLEEMLNESRLAEDKAKKAMIDAARLADELRAEQENAQCG